MDNIIKKISHFLTFTILFFASAYFYFNYKGFVYENGKIVLKQQIADASEHKGIAVVLPKNLNVNASMKYAKGSVSAPLTLYEYSSLGCPHCADFHLSVLPKLEEEFVDNGLLRIVFVNFPLDKKSMKAAMISECMTYDNYFGFMTSLFDRQRSWWLDSDDEQLYRFAAEYGLSYDETEACANNDKVAQEIVADRQEALTSLHVQGTPAFLISGADGNEIIYGAPSYKSIREYLHNRLQNYMQ